MFARVALALAALAAAITAPAMAGERSTFIDVAARSLWQRDANSGGDWSPQYAAAMLNYRHFARSINGVQAGGAYPMLPGSTNLNGLAWVWVAPDGSHVQRVNQGLFRLYRRDRSSTFYRVIDCHPLDWPEFECSDGRRREMSAPTYALMVFDDKEFERPFTPSLPVGEPAGN